jgi:hypothetical protein
MVDLSPEQPLTVAQQTQVEEHMRTSALRAHQLLVKSVYWRVVPASAANTASTVATPTVHQPNKALAPEPTVPTAPNPVAAATPASRQPRITRPVYDPIDPAEVQAFKQAVAAAQAKPAAPPAAPDSAFPDTQVLDPEDNASALSRTQYGELD